MLSNKELNEIKEKGFIRIPAFLSELEIEGMLSTITDYRLYHYNEKNIRDRVAYLSDSSETRISNAYMVSTGSSPLPHLIVENNSVLGDIIDDFQMILMQLSDSSGSTRNTRLMLNMQEYKQKSKIVPWHFDGEYLDFNEIDNDGQINLKKGLIPNFVGVYTLYNNNKYATKVRSLVTLEEFEIESEAGDLFLFDNTKFLHSVPELKEDRAMFGFRNFDYNPYLYSQDYTTDSFAVRNQCFKGYARKIKTEESVAIQEDFIEDWKENYKIGLKAKF